MIIKSHIRGGYRAAADYLKEQGKNEYTRIVEISDPSAKNLDEAFQNMWAIAANTRCTKPLHHISINPMKDERLTDAQVLAIVERCEEKYGYKMFHHQRVIVEHIKDGRQHFHVIWNRVSLMTGRPVWPGHHWKKSKQVCREMEKELGLKRPISRRTKHAFIRTNQAGRRSKISGRYSVLKTRHTSRTVYPSSSKKPKPLLPALTAKRSSLAGYGHMPFIPARIGKRRKKNENLPDSEKLPFRRPEWATTELLAWAWENGRIDILAQYGIYLPPDYFEP